MGKSAHDPIVMTSCSDNVRTFTELFPAYLLFFNVKERFSTLVFEALVEKLATNTVHNLHLEVFSLQLSPRASCEIVCDTFF